MDQRPPARPPDGQQFLYNMYPQQRPPPVQPNFYREHLPHIVPSQGFNLRAPAVRSVDYAAGRDAGAGLDGVVGRRDDTGHDVEDETWEPSQAFNHPNQDPHAFGPANRAPPNSDQPLFNEGDQEGIFGDFHTFFSDDVPVPSVPKKQSAWAGAECYDLAVITSRVNPYIRPIDQRDKIYQKVGAVLGGRTSGAVMEKLRELAQFHQNDDSPKFSHLKKLLGSRYLIPIRSVLEGLNDLRNGANSVAEGAKAEKSKKEAMDKRAGEFFRDCAKENLCRAEKRPRAYSESSDSGSSSDDDSSDDSFTSGRGSLSPEQSRPSTPATGNRDENIPPRDAPPSPSRLRHEQSAALSHIDSNNLATASRSPTHSPSPSPSERRHRSPSATHPNEGSRTPGGSSFRTPSHNGSPQQASRTSPQGPAVSSSRSSRCADAMPEPDAGVHRSKKRRTGRSNAVLVSKVLEKHQEVEDRRTRKLVKVVREDSMERNRLLGRLVGGMETMIDLYRQSMDD